MSSMTTVDPALLTLLNPEEAVDLFRDLLWAESWRQGINILDVSVPSNITAADGGVDAEVKAAPATNGLLSEGLTRYQIKTGDFSATQDAKVKELFFKKNTTELKERVEYCLKNNGTFVVVLFGNDNPDTTDGTTTVTKCVDLLKHYHPAIIGPKIKVIRANELAGVLSMHVAMSLRAQRIGNARFRTHQEWSSQSDMQPVVHYGSAQENIRSQLEAELRGRARAVHVCLTGEPGVGKTRLVLEATRAPDLAPLVVYCPSPQHCNAGGIVELLLHDQRRHAVIVVDDADLQDAQALWNAFEHQGSRIKLVTLQHEFPRVGGSTVLLAVPPLDDDQVLEILQQYVPGYQSRGFVPLCSGSPRVAHVIGGNLQRYPNDLLLPPDTVDVWGRYISGNDDPASERVRERHTILQYCALFRKFGCRNPVAFELQAIIALLQRDHPEITDGKIHEAILELRRRRILQGETTLYITPKALHIRLWGEWWELHGPIVELEPFVEALPEKMRGWFYEMFRYAQESGVATRLVEQLLGSTGPFVTTSLLKAASGAEVFSVLAEANPAGGLNCLEATIGKYSTQELRANTEHRRQLVWALERIAMWRPFFARAARLLAKLAVAENEARIANNATGVFCDLFSLGPGEVAPTEAPPEERLPLLAAMLADTQPEVRRLAVQACGKALNYGHFVRSCSAEYQGLRIPPELWRPKTHGEWFSAYEQIWTLMLHSLPNLEATERAEAIRYMIQHSHQLGGIPRLGSLVISTLREIAETGLSKRELVEQVEHVVAHLKDYPEQDRPSWIALLESVYGGTGFVGRLHRFAGMTAWQLDEAAEQTLRDLAREAIEDPQLFNSSFPWLLSNEAQNAHAFGYQLGKADEDWSLWSLLLGRASAGVPVENVSILGGYLRATKERDEGTWYSQLVACSTEDILVPTLHLLIFQSELTDEAGMLLVHLIKGQRLPALALRQFIIGTEIRNLSEATFAEWRMLLRQAGADEMQALIELMHAYYARSKPARPVPLPETVDILTDERLFAERSRNSGMLTDHAWADLARSVVAQDANQIPPLGETVLDNLGIRSAVLQHFGDSGPTIWLREVAVQHPLLVWQLVKERLGPPIDRRAFHLKDWIDNSNIFDKRQPNFLDTVPREELWAWVDADLEHRAWYLAHLVAPIFAANSLARAVLVRYGHREDVQLNLRANFDTEGWSGPESAHHSAKRRALESVLAEDVEPNVREWIMQYLALIDQRIEQARVREEREF